jgi:deoxycytidylate deaminase
LHDKETKLRLVVHAEVNAILNAARVGIPLKGCTLYLAATDDTGAVWGGPPCTRCSLDMIQAGITRVVSLPFKPNFHTCQAALPEDPQNTAHFVSLGKIVVLNIGIL